MSTVKEAMEKADELNAETNKRIDSIGEQIAALQEKMGSEEFQEAVTKLQLDVDAVKDTLEKLSDKIGDIPVGGESVGKEVIERVARLERQLGMK